MNLTDIKFGQNICDTNELHLKSEIRHLPLKDRIQLSHILDINDNWKQLAAVIPNPDGSEGYLITNSNISVLEDFKSKRGGSPTQALLDFWGTTGRKRATIEDLIQLLNKCQLYRASNFLCNDLLHIQSFETLCHNKSDNYFSDNSTHLDLNKDYFDNSCNQLNNLSTKLLENSSSEAINKENDHLISPSAPNESQISFNSFEQNNRELLANEELVHYCYDEIQKATNNFNSISVSNGGNMLGEGAFGSVYRCRLSTSSQTNTYFAVKKLKNDFEKQFVSELKVMNTFKHQNLLSLCGISSDGPSLCIVYEYMPNGSLQDCIANNKGSLSWPRRISIAIETAKGICHLHTFAEKPYVHRDIKSANILLDSNFNARVGDFGLVRIGSRGVSTSTHPSTTTVIGTSAYMAPEAFRGDISVKLDTFSFGVVLLELLTGLSPYDQNREELDLLSYVDEKVENMTHFGDDYSLVVNSLMDTSAEQWGHDIALQLYQISRECTKDKKKDRPTMIEVLQSLEK